MFPSLFPRMSVKDRIMGLIGMFIYVCMGFFPILFLGLLSYAPLELFWDSRLVVVIKYLVAISMGLYAFAWLFEGGFEMITKEPPQGLRPGDSKPWKHNGGWE